MECFKSKCSFNSSSSLGFRDRFAYESVRSVMEWNAKSPSQWDWEQLFLFNTKAIENPRIEPTDWSGEGDREINVGCFYPSGHGGCSGSELIHASSSRSSKSASINCSSNAESKTSKSVCEGSQEDSNSKKDVPKEDLIAASPVLEPSPFSGEPMLSLKLGKRLYVEDLCRGNDTQNLSFSVAPKPSLSTGKKFKSNSQSPQPARCQVEGCSLDLSSAKDYHRKHRVCESHSKSPKVVVGGLERRFCQQCSRFHSLSEFDDKKRSCRRRLSNHNARRRKPHPDIVQLNPSPLATSPYDGRQRMSLFANPRTINLTWQDKYGIKLPRTKDFHMQPGGINSQASQQLNGLSSTITALSDDSSSPFASQGISVKTFNSGVEDSSGTSSNQYPTNEFSRAHSLLSSNFWGSYGTKSLSHTDHAGVSQPMTHSMMQRSPLFSSEDWQTHRQPIDSRMCISFSDYDGGNLLQNLEHISSSHDTGFP